MSKTIHQAIATARQEIRTNNRGFVPSHATDTMVLQNIWEKRMKDGCEGFFGKPPAAQHESLTLFVKDAERNGIPNSEAMRFVRQVQYRHRIAHAMKVSQDQAPGLVFISSTPWDPAHKAINHDCKKIRDGELHGGTFAISSEVNMLREASLAPDFQPVFYILNHNAHKGHPLPPYVLVCTSFAEKERDALLAAASISIARRDKLREDARVAGQLVIGNKWLVPTKSGNIPVHLVAMIHDVRTRNFLVVDKTSVGKGISVSGFGEWCKLNGLTSHPVVARHIDNMAIHMSDKHYADSLALDSGCGSDKCTDSRMPHNNGTNTHRKIGAIPSEAEFKERAKNPGLDDLEYVVHTKCGYLSTATAIHKMFAEIEKLTESKSIIRKRISDAVANIIARKQFGMNIPAFLNDLGGLSEASSATFKLFFGSTDDSFRSVFVHMARRDLFATDSHSGLPFMPPARKIEVAIAAAKSAGQDILPGMESLLIHEEVANQLQTTLLSWQVKHGDELIAARNGREINVRVVMVGMDTARKWYPPEEVSLELQGRQDAMLQNEFIPPQIIALEL